MITHLVKGKSIFEKINKCTSSKIFCRNLCEMGQQPLRKFSGRNISTVIFTMHLKKSVTEKSKQSSCINFFVKNNLKKSQIIIMIIIIIIIIIVIINQNNNSRDLFSSSIIRFYRAKENEIKKKEN